jgi:hypothetical protein
MPNYENTLGFEDFFGLDDLLSEVLAVVLNFCPHVVDHEWL